MGHNLSRDKGNGIACPELDSGESRRIYNHPGVCRLRRARFHLIIFCFLKVRWNLAWLIIIPVCDPVGTGLCSISSLAMHLGKQRVVLQETPDMISSMVALDNSPGLNTPTNTIRLRKTGLNRQNYIWNDN